MGRHRSHMQYQGAELPATAEKAIGREGCWSRPDDAHRGALHADDPDAALDFGDFGAFSRRGAPSTEAGSPFGLDVVEVEGAASALPALQAVYPGH